MLALQRVAGNAAVAHLLSASVGGPTTWLAVQRDPDPIDPASVDARTRPGFFRRCDNALELANATMVDAIDLGSPYRERMGSLIDGVSESTNDLNEALDRLVAVEGRDAGRAAEAEARVHVLEVRTDQLIEVLEAWRQVGRSQIMELLAAVGQARLDRAQALRRELDELHAELLELRAIAGGAEVDQAMTQLGVNAAISTALLAISIANPVVGLAVAVGGALVTLTIDYYLGPTTPGLDSQAAAVTGVVGTGLEGFASPGTRLRTAGGRLGVAGAAVGTLVDAGEVQIAIDQYMEARRRLVHVSRRYDRAAREYNRLRPILAYPGMATRTIAGLREQAAVLRQHGQLRLGAAGQL